MCIVLRLYEQIICYLTLSLDLARGIFNSINTYLIDDKRNVKLNYWHVQADQR